MLQTRNTTNHLTFRGVSVGLLTAFALVIGIGVGQASAAGGTVTGTVKFKGTPPPAPSAVPVSTNNEACGAQHTPDPMVAADGGVQWAVVRILGAKGEFPATAEPPALDQHGCRFIPHVVTVPVGKPLKVLNSDGILHNVHTFSDKNTPVNTAQPAFRKTIDVTFDKPEIVRVACDVHPWMSGQIVVTDTPFVAVTDDKGAFSIGGVPAGTYSVSVWHENFGEQTLKVTVVDGKAASLPVTVAAK